MKKKNVRGFWVCFVVLIVSTMFVFAGSFIDNQTEENVTETDIVELPVLNISRTNTTPEVNIVLNETMNITNVNIINTTETLEPVVNETVDIVSQVEYIYQHKIITNTYGNKSENLVLGLKVLRKSKEEFKLKYEEAELNIDLKSIRKIKFNDLEIINDTISIGIGEFDIPRYVQSYAIDPTQLNFTEAVVTVVAKGTELYKCKDWNFSKQECFGEWVLFKDDLIPGEEYSFILTTDDPGFGETADGFIPTNATHSADGDVTSSVNASDNVESNIAGNSPGEYITITAWNDTVPSTAKLLNATLHLEIDNVNNDIQWEVTVDTGSGFGSVICYATAVSNTNYTCDLFTNGIDTTAEINNLDVRITGNDITSGGPAESFDLDFVHFTGEYERIQWNQSTLDLGENSAVNGNVTSEILIQSILGNTNVAVACSGNCTNIVTNWATKNMAEGQNDTVLITCSNASAGVFQATFNVTSDEDASADFITVDCEMITYGSLSVAMSLPTNNQGVSQGQTFIINATVSCSGSAGDKCGTVSALARYNASSSSIDTPITTINGALPLFIPPRMANFTGDINISTTADGPRSVYAIDIDGDGDIDVLSASYNDDKIAWYENNGSESFTENIISTSANGAYSVYAIDIDGDGDIDLLSASSLDDKIAWYENNGSESFTENIISTGANSARFVYALDIDGDGDIDVLSASYNDDKIAWYENNGSESFTENIISTTASGAEAIYAIDIDGDGDIDVLSASLTSNKIAWYENNGSESFTENIISTSANNAESVFAIDVDGDGDIDVLSASIFDDKIAWYENNGSESFTENIISTTADSARSVYAIDIDGDGDIDVISGSYDDDTIAWYENDGSESFTENIISTSANGARYVYAIDVDGDNDIDVLSASFVGDNIAWYENTGVGQNSQSFVLNQGDSFNVSWIVKASGTGSYEIDVFFNSSYGTSNVADNDTIDATVCIGTCDGGDTTPPASVTNLANQSATASSIYWNWTNPGDADFSQAIVFIDGNNTANTSNNFYNATALTADTSYTITVHTKDNVGNVNDTDVNGTAKTLADNAPPNITLVNSISDITLTQFGTSTSYVLMNITDLDGFADLNDSLARCSFFKSGEATRNSTSCVGIDQSGNNLAYNCTVSMYYYDSAGLWNVSCYVEDVSGGSDDDTSKTVIVNGLNHIVQNVTTIDWDALDPGVDDQEALERLEMINGGNQGYTNFNISSQNATFGSDVIEDTRFMIDSQAGQTTGQTRLNSSGVDWNEGILSKCTAPCSTNSTEAMYFYVDTPTGIIGGIYASIANWTISIS